ncbi:MAG: GNAT family N-acetyltransferase [Anaerolineales bacterium]|nr:GNAT family N-acetyltransferase [Anaerolineales bacterium]
MTPPVLRTARLVLRPLTPADADALFPIFADAETMRFMPSPPHRDARETRAQLAADMGRAGACHWGIYVGEGAAPVGMVNYLGETAVPGMGYVLRREYWGQGITAEACRAVLAYGFETLGYDRVELWIDETNAASQRVAQKLGFRLRGQLAMKYGHHAQHHVMFVYGLWAAEWRGEAPPQRTRFFRAEPVLYTHDVAATVAFYREQLGFDVDFLYGEPPTYAAVARRDWSGQGVVLQIAQVPRERPIAPAGHVYLFVDAAIDDLFAAYRARGVEMVDELTSHPWGMREFALRDPNGHVLRFGTQG